jgi:hypothetical protein
VHFADGQFHAADGVEHPLLQLADVAVGADQQAVSSLSNSSIAFAPVRNLIR